MERFDGWDTELYHHGIKGQKWGIRRFQNSDGTLTAEGKARYGEGGSATGKGRARFLNALDRQRAHAAVKQKEQLKKRSQNSDYKAKQYQTTQDVTNRTIRDVLAAAKKDNYSIGSKPVRRHVVTGQTVAKSIAMTVALNAALTAMSVGPAMYYGQKLAGASGAVKAAITGAKFAPTGAVVGTKVTAGTKYKDKTTYK